jgi:hypothetical protein
MKNKIFTLFLLFFSTISYAQRNNEWIKFNWHGDSIYGKYYDKVAITIPIKIDNLPYNFCSQFDMGATKTVLYGVSLKPFLNNNYNLLQKLDTTIAPYYLNGHKGNFLTNVNLQLDKTLFAKSKIVYVPDIGDPISYDSINSATQKLVGTIAVDLFQNKILVLDFKNDRLCTYTKLPEKYAKAVFEKAVIRKGRVKLPLKIGDKIVYVMFDTGSCIGDLLLDKETINQVAEITTPKEEFLNGNTWGENVAYFNKKIEKLIYFNNIKLDIKDAQFSDLERDIQFNKEEKIIGTLGPVLFSKSVVIIDYINNRFGVLL